MLVVHPSGELYGSDRVALESARAFVDAGWTVQVGLGEDGPLAGLLTSAGCDVAVAPAPVLRKAHMSPRGLLRLALRTLRCTPGMVALLRRGFDVVYVSTLTTPWWLVLARATRALVVCHVHEAEEEPPRPVRIALAAPLLLAHRVIANSRASRDVLCAAVPVLARRTQVVHNGVPGPDAVRPARTDPVAPVRLVLVSRINPRKGTEAAVECLAVLREQGVEATLDLVGSTFPGYEWFEEDVRERVRALGLEAAVRWRGVLPDVWEALGESDIALVPSRVESFGNAAVEAMLACRPVVAGPARGLREIVRAGENGELVDPAGPQELAAAVRRLLADWPSTLARAAAAREEAERLYSPARFRRAVVAAASPSPDGSGHPAARAVGRTG